MKVIVVITCLIVAIAAQLNDYQHWVSFKDKYSKHYKITEDKLRFKIFQDNLRGIEEHNARYARGEVSWFKGVTTFADWTKEEFKALLTRQAASRPKLNESLGVYIADPNVNVPSSVDWRNEGAVLPVRNQGACGSCWAFSTEHASKLPNKKTMKLSHNEKVNEAAHLWFTQQRAKRIPLSGPMIQEKAKILSKMMGDEGEGFKVGALEGQVAIHKNQTVSLSPQNLIDCSTENLGCEDGDQVKAFKYVKSNGISSEADYPYHEKDQECNKNVKKSIASLSGYKHLNPTEEDLISAIATVGPIAVSADASDWPYYAGGIYDDKYCGDHINHAILATGYTDEYILIKNSWGEDWGEDGYMRIARGKNICHINDDNSYPIL